MRDRSPDELETRAAAERAKRDIVEARRDAYIQRIVAAAPPLTGEQRARLAVLFAPPVEDAAAEAAPVERRAPVVSTADVVDAV